MVDNQNFEGYMVALGEYILHCIFQGVHVLYILYFTNLHIVGILFFIF